VGFHSVHYYVTGASGAVDILQWTVQAGAGRDATWNRQYVARGVARPY
jgi:hypothetical protein